MNRELIARPALLNTSKVQRNSPLDRQDEELLAQFVRAGDGRAFETLMRRHAAVILGVCQRILRDPHLAEDAFQETFLILAQKAPAIENPRRLEQWLYGVASRTALKIKTRAGRPKRFLANACHQPEWQPGPTSELLPSDDVSINELRKAFLEELNRLPARYREVLVLCCIDGRTHEEAAEILGFPVGSISGYIHRAKQRLRKALEKRGFSAAAAAVISIGFFHGRVSQGVTDAFMGGADQMLGFQPENGLAKGRFPEAYSRNGWHKGLLQKAKLRVSIVLVAILMTGTLVGWEGARLPGGGFSGSTRGQASPYAREGFWHHLTGLIPFLERDPSSSCSKGSGSKSTNKQNSLK